MGGTGEAITGATRVRLRGTGVVRTSKSRHRWIGTRIEDTLDEHMGRRIEEIGDEYMGGTTEMTLCQTGVSEGVPRRGTHVRIVASGTKRLVFCAKSAGPMDKAGSQRGECE